MRARLALDLSPGPASSPATPVADEMVRADSTSARGMHALPEELAHALTALDALAVVAQDIGKAVDSLDQGAAVRGHDVLVEGRVTLGEAHHASKSRTTKSSIRNRPHRPGVGDADGERQMTEKGHLPVVNLGREDLWSRPQGPNEAEPFIEWGQILAVLRCEDPGLSPEQRRIAFTQAAAFLARDRMSAEESIRIGKGAGPLQDGTLHAGNVGHDRASRDDGGEALEDRPDLVDGRGDHDEVAVGKIA